jgi:hypothetical protein
MSDGRLNTCGDCTRKIHRARYWNNAEEAREKAIEWRRSNLDRSRENNRKYRSKNRKDIIVRNRTYYRQNRERCIETSKLWKLSNRARATASDAKRRAAKLQATPGWLTQDHLEEIRAFYVEAQRRTQETGIKYSVDHIIPLQGKDVCGLHVPWNLQVIPLLDNIRKGRRYRW